MYLESYAVEYLPKAETQNCPLRLVAWVSLVTSVREVMVA